MHDDHVHIDGRACHSLSKFGVRFLLKSSVRAQYGRGNEGSGVKSGHLP